MARCPFSVNSVAGATMAREASSPDFPIATRPGQAWKPGLLFEGAWNRSSDASIKQNTTWHAFWNASKAKLGPRLKLTEQEWLTWRSKQKRMSWEGSWLHSPISWESRHHTLGMDELRALALQSHLLVETFFSLLIFTRLRSGWALGLRAGSLGANHVYALSRECPPTPPLRPPLESPVAPQKLEIATSHHFACATLCGLSGRSTSRNLWLLCLSACAAINLDSLRG